jgi:uncharacterized repeat protein (TIGR01451 family)
MMQRLPILGVVFTAIVFAGFGLAQYPAIPPQNVPQTAEPGLADQRVVPKQLPPDLQRLSNTEPRLGTPIPARNTAIEELRPASSDPPIPAVAIRIRAPGHVAAGSPIEYTITVENFSQASAHHVTVTNPIPTNSRFESAEPKPGEVTPALVRWKLGTMAPGVSKEIKLKLTPTGDGEFADVARVTFEHGQRVSTVIDKPRVTLKRLAPQYAHENDRIPVTLVVENTGRVEVSNLIVKEVVADGLKHENGTQEQTWAIPTLRPGEKSEKKYTVSATKQGTFTSTASVKEDRFRTDQQTVWTVMIGKPSVYAKISGPLKTYLTQPAEYTVLVRNEGTVPLDNVTVAISLPPAFKVVKASQDSQAFKDRLQWGIKHFEPRATREYRFSLQTAVAGKAQIILNVLSKTDPVQSTVETDFQGATALRLRVRESSNRVQVGDRITYTVSIQNTGTIAATKVYVDFDLPKIGLVTLDPSSEQALRKDQKDPRLVWGPELTVPAGKTISMEVTATAVRDGIMLFQASLDGKTGFEGGAIRHQVQTVIEPK